MKVQYRASTKEGKIISGVIEAKDTHEAIYFLRNKEMVPLSLKKVEESQLPFLSFFKKSSNNDLVLFTRQLSSILSSGLTLMQALSILKEQIQNQTMKEVVEGIISDVQEGKTFSQSIQKYPRVFNPIYISLIRSAESS